MSNLGINFPDYGIKIKPIKKNYKCIKCGRKRTITYNRRCNAGGLLSTANEQCLPYMLCPRCKNKTMIEVEEE